VKKLISVGVALALLTMVVVPGAVAAQDIEPDTYSKIPFAIVGSGIVLVGQIVDAMGDTIDLPFDIVAITELVGPWTAEDLAWSVDMLAWGVNLFGELWPTLDEMLGIGYEDLGDVMVDVADGLRECWVDVCP